ncbi:MAG: RBBP9/YdeN family alpha/beta hydrolase [Candidatus Nealsonbacteria bacterium]
MNKRILILHGWESNSKEHWFLEEKERLEKLGHKVFVPDMPNTFHPKKEQWIKVIEDFDPDSRSVLVGHSLGGTVILNYLEKIDEKIKRCVLIATPIEKLSFKPTNNFFEPNFDWQKIKQNCEEFFILNQTKDPWVPLEHGESLATYVNGKLIKVDGDDHFDAIDFPMLEKCILK